MSVTGADLGTGIPVRTRNTLDPVTGVESPRVQLVNTRNLHRLDWRLLKAAKEEAAEQVKRARAELGARGDIFALLDALRRNDVPEEEEASRRVREAQRTAQSCGQCGRSLEGDEAVYLAPKVYTGIAVLVRQLNFHRAPVCSDCAPVDITERKKTHGNYAGSVYVDEPCGGCGRPVVLRTTYGLYGRCWHVFCCERCRWTHYNGLRNDRNARAREKACEGCGEPFTATRRDAKTCSAACKQRAYRLRKKGEV